MHKEFGLVAMKTNSSSEETMNTPITNITLESHSLLVPSCDSPKSYCKKSNFLTCDTPILTWKSCYSKKRVFKFTGCCCLIFSTTSTVYAECKLNKYCNGEIGLTVQSNIRKCQDDRAVRPWSSCHGAVELSILSLYVLLLKQTHRFSHTFRSLIHAAVCAPGWGYTFGKRGVFCR